MEFFLLQATDVNNAANYLPVGLQMLFAVGLIATIIVGSNYLGPKRATADKLQNFESGIQKTVIWYLDNIDWVNNILSGGYQLERIGLGTQ